jgi:hypothetical protein
LLTAGAHPRDVLRVGAGVIRRVERVAAVQQEAHHGFVPVRRGEMERGALHDVACVDARALVEQHRRDGNAAVDGGAV